VEEEQCPRQNAASAELQSLKERFGNQAAGAELLDVDKSSVTRWLKRGDKPDPENEERIAALRYVMVRLLRFSHLKRPWTGS
jgi:hypothetical protein